MLRPDSVEWVDSALSTTRTCGWIFQFLSEAVSRQPQGSDRDRRSVPELGKEPLAEMGCSDPGRSHRPPRRIRRALLQACETRSGGGHCQGTRTGKDYDRHWYCA